MWGEQREDRYEKQAKGTFLTGFVQKEYVGVEAPEDELSSRHLAHT